MNLKLDLQAVVGTHDPTLAWGGVHCRGQALGCPVRLAALSLRQKA